MIPPTVSYGNEFIVVPLASRLAGDIIRVLAHEEETDVRKTNVWVQITYIPYRFL